MTNKDILTDPDTVSRLLFAGKQFSKQTQAINH